MDKRDYFLQAIKAGAGRKRHWVNSIFSVVIQQTAVQPYPYQLLHRPEGYTYLDPDLKTEHVIITESPDGPLCGFRERFMLAPGELENYAKGTLLETTYGNVLVNQLALVDSFGSEIDFQVGEINIEAIEKILDQRWIDDPEDDTALPPPGKVFTRQVLQFNRTVLSLVAYNHLAVHSVTPKSMLHHPEARRIRAELMVKYKDQLSDPVIVARIGEALEKLDREWLANDPSMGFYNAKPGKYFGAARSRQFYMFGGEAAFSDGTSVEFIPYSLEEGIDVTKLPAMINSLREGSYNRGAMTQLGGESTKTIYRMLGTVRVAEPDCGTLLGIYKIIDDTNISQMVGFYIYEHQKEVLLTNDNINRYRDQMVLMRNPLTCQTEGNNVCAHCVGEVNAQLENGIAATAAQLGGRFLTAFLKKMHAAALRTAQYSITDRIR